VARNFKSSRANQVWVGDITYIQTREGWLYLSVLLDLYSRRVVGWSMRDDMKAELVVNTLDMTLKLRSPSQGLIVHSDRGRFFRVIPSLTDEKVEHVINTIKKLRR